MIESARDIQPVLNKDQLQKANDLVAEITALALAEGSAEIILANLQEIVKAKTLSGILFSKYIYQLYIHWDKFIESESDDLSNYLYAMLGTSPHTTERYIKVQMLIENAPEEYKDRANDTPIGRLIPAAHAESQGYELEAEDWEKILTLENDKAANDYIRETVKGKEPRKHGIRIWMDRRGSLWAFQEDQRIFIGSLEIENDDELVQKAVERIVKQTGITKQ